jgi:hypothetical protein
MPGAARFLVLVMLGLLLTACGGAGGSGGGGGGTPLTAFARPVPPSAPVLLSAEGNDGSVDIVFSADPSAVITQLQVQDVTDPAAPGPRLLVSDVRSPHRQGGLTNMRTYEFTLISSNLVGSSPLSDVKRAQPGPVPATPLSMTAVATNGVVDLHWTPVAGVDGYRVFFADERALLAAPRRPGTSFVDAPADATSARVPKAKFYRVQAVLGPRVDFPGPVAYLVGFNVIRHVDINQRLRGNVQDWNGDDCPDIPTALGDCTGALIPVDLEARGLAGLFANGRINGDTRIADMDGDGDFDFFTNTYITGTDPTSKAIFHRNRGDGTFEEDPQIRDMAIGGFGETLALADFNNDSRLDIFLTHYWHTDDNGRNWLLINEGDAGFRDIAESAGVLRGQLPVFVFYPFVPEGVQAMDFDGDGWIDFYVASYLYINNRDLTFTDRRSEYGLPVLFDEGVTFADVDLDGDFDLVHNAITALRVFRNNGGTFGAEEILETYTDKQSYGLNVCDINADGYPEILWAAVNTTTVLGRPSVFLNVRGQFVKVDYDGDFLDNHNVIGCADLDRNGSQDLTVYALPFSSFVANSGALPHLRVRVLDANGQRNQYGRVVRIRPSADAGITIARYVDGGSGYHTQTDYDIVVGTPWPGTYEVTVEFADGPQVATATAGELLVFRRGVAEVTRSAIADIR